MISHIIKTDQGLMLKLPENILETLKLAEGEEVTIGLNPTRTQIVITPVTKSSPTVDEAFAQQVDEFIEQYRPALEALAK